MSGKRRRKGHRVVYGGTLRSKYRIDRRSGCWLWKGALNSKGYPLVRWKGRMELAHRILREQATGEYPGGLTGHHCCPHRRCVNPAHVQFVELVTHNNSHWR